MTYLLPALAAAVLVLLVALVAAIAAWRTADRTNASLSRRCTHQAGRIRSLRSEANLLAEACDRLTAERDQLREKTDPPLPTWGRRTLLDIARATSPDAFRKDNR